MEFVYYIKDIFTLLIFKLFVQLNEWQPSDPLDFYSDRHWKEKSRWIKFEEDWEQGAEKWGKPHVAQLTFHSLPQLRRFLEGGRSLKIDFT